ncbi:MAG: hypothetical protein HY815_25725 [Candidatus Riflebacteria bacterium]|nr:hypothetical protein [Candidatus Riflebacteria bacterium]
MPPVNEVLCSARLSARVWQPGDSPGSQATFDLPELDHGLPADVMTVRHAVSKIPERRQGAPKRLRNREDPQELPERGHGPWVGRHGRMTRRVMRCSRVTLTVPEGLKPRVDLNGRNCIRCRLTSGSDLRLHVQAPADQLPGQRRAHQTAAQIRSSGTPTFEEACPGDPRDKAPGALTGQPQVQLRSSKRIGSGTPALDTGNGVQVLTDCINDGGRETFQSLSCVSVESFLQRSIVSAPKWRARSPVPGFRKLEITPSLPGEPMMNVPGPQELLGAPESIQQARRRSPHGPVIRLRSLEARAGIQQQDHQTVLADVLGNQVHQPLRLRQPRLYRMFR